MTVPERLSALRAEMAERNIDTYVVLSEDAHQSEYVADYWRARAFITGFTGSAGTAVITKDTAACFADGRYFLQAEKQLEGTGFTLMRMGTDGVKPFADYAVDVTPEGGVLALDGRTIGTKQAGSLRGKLEKKGASLKVDEDLVGLIWADRPALPQDEVKELPECFAGESRAARLAKVREHLSERGADWQLVAALDSVAWLMNLRGNDIHCTPVAYAYALIGREEAFLFIEEAKVGESVRASLAADGVKVLPYDALLPTLESLPVGTLSWDAAQISERIAQGLPAGWTVKPEDGADIVTVLKAVKNDTEIENIRKAHVKDGAVMVRLLKWVKDHADAGVTECDAADWLDAERRSQVNALDISFDTIAGYGSNGAIVHYKPERPDCATIKPEGFLLVDSGAQYLEGTTDITRTIACGPLTDEMKRAYTLVLKGHLALGRAVFPDSATGTHLDVLARQPLWEEGLDFRHGTGHGVGYVLSVHEGPQRISTVWNDTKIRPGMVISNEPGYYPTGKFGVRIENLVIAQPACETEWGRFLRFETVTLCPYEREAIVKDMLTPDEIAWVNAYHAEVRAKVSPLLSAEERAFLEEATRPL